MATWENSKFRSNSGTNEHAKLCFMATTEEVLSKPNSYFEIMSDTSFSSSNWDENNDISFEDLHTSCNSIFEKHFKLKQRFKDLTLKNDKFERDQVINSEKILSIEQKQKIDVEEIELFLRVI